LIINFYFSRLVMRPSELSSELRRIAAAVDASKKPDRQLVAAALKRVLRVAAGDENQVLMDWLHEVLSNQMQGATVVLPDGSEAIVKLEGNTVRAYAVGENEPELCAQVSLVPG
jgi:hypothetical protein